MRKKGSWIQSREKNTPVPPQRGSRLWNGTANKTCIHPHPAPDLLFCVRRDPAKRQTPHRDTWQPLLGPPLANGLEKQDLTLICFLLSFRECKDQKKTGQVAQSIAERLLVELCATRLENVSRGVSLRFPRRKEAGEVWRCNNSPYNKTGLLWGIMVLWTFILGLDPDVLVLKKHFQKS